MTDPDNAGKCRSALTMSRGGCGQRTSLSLRSLALMVALAVLPSVMCAATLPPLTPAAGDRPDTIAWTGPVTWRLDPKDVELLAASLTIDWDKVPPKEREAVRQPLQWTAMLAPLVGMDYPSEAHFRKGLHVAHCAWFLQLQQPAEAKHQQKTHTPQFVDDDACPDETATVAPAERGRTTPRELFNALLPSSDAVVLRAQKPHRPDPAFSAPWTAVPSCGCVPQDRDSELYGFVSYWGTAEQQQAAAASAPAGVRPARHVARRQVDFSLFSRLSFFGAVLNDEAEYDLPPEVRADGHRLAHDARRHGTETDLVVYRRQWKDLLERPTDLQVAFAARAAEAAVKLADAPQEHLNPWAQALLLPWWRERMQTYDGITVFFDDLPADGTKEATAFRALLRSYVLALVRRMQRSGRAYHLNIVVPEDRVGEAALFEFGWMLDLIEEAEPPRNSKNTHASEKRHFRGTTDITLNYIVPLTDQTGASKKDLRRRLDASDVVRGSQRVMLLESLVPMLRRPARMRWPGAHEEPTRQFDADLAYMKWVFGGVALWELPARDYGDPALLDLLARNFRREARGVPGLCDWACPRRIALRLGLQALLVVGAVTAAHWFATRRARPVGRSRKVLVWVGGLGTAGLALVLLDCDPALQEVSVGPWPLVGALIAAALYKAFRRRSAGASSA